MALSMIFLAGFIVGIVTAIAVLGMMLPDPETIEAGIIRAELRSRMLHPSRRPAPPPIADYDDDDGTVRIVRR